MRIMAIDYGDAHTGIAISDPPACWPASPSSTPTARPGDGTDRTSGKEHRWNGWCWGIPSAGMDGTAALLGKAQPCGAGGDHRPDGGPVGRAAPPSTSPDPDEQRQERQEAEKGSGRCGGIADSRGLPHHLKRTRRG